MGENGMVRGSSSISSLEEDQKRGTGDVARR